MERVGVGAIRPQADRHREAALPTLLLRLSAALILGRLHGGRTLVCENLCRGTPRAHRGQQRSRARLGNRAEHAGREGAVKGKP